MPPARSRKRVADMHMHDEYILERLMQGETVSGEALSREMGLSRAAIWKAILRLR